MNPSDPDRRTLLDELIPPTVGSNPAWSELLDAIDAEKRKRRFRKRLLATCSCGVVLAAGAIVITQWQSVRPIDSVRNDQIAAVHDRSAQRSVPPTAEEPFSIARIGDEELLTLLPNIPTALVEWDDGRRAVMVMVEPRRLE